MRSFIKHFHFSSQTYDYNVKIRESECSVNNRGWGLLSRSHLQSIKYKQSFTSSHFSDFMQMSEHKYCQSRADLPGLQAVVMICWIQSLISSPRPASGNQLLRCMNFFPCSQYPSSSGCGQNEKKEET